MSNEMDKKKIVNGSGFPLQLAVAHAIKNNSTWNLLYEEHEWHTEHDRGFIDLVIEDQNRTWVMNIECKRVRNSTWLFLGDSNSSIDRRVAKLWITSRKNAEKLNYFGWVDLAMDPGSVQSLYCVVAGQDDKAKPMLERVAATVVKSTEALALHEANVICDDYATLRIYQNVIVTTAELWVCNADPSRIDIATGEVGDDSEFTKVPYLRFRKQLGSEVDSQMLVSDIYSLQKLSKQRESTVFVVNSSSFVEFLTACELPENLTSFITA